MIIIIIIIIVIIIIMIIIITIIIMIIIIKEKLQNFMHQNQIKMPHSLVIKILVRFPSCKSDLNGK